MRKLLRYIQIGLLLISSVYFWYFSIIPQYDIRDNEGYLAGAIVLAGYVSFVVLTNVTKQYLIIIGKKKYIYILSIINIITGYACVRTLLFYYSRLYLGSLLLFWIVPLVFCGIRLICKKKEMTLKINYMMSLYIAGMAAVLSIIVRGFYFTKIAVVLAILGIVVGLITEAQFNLSDNTSRYEYFPYDFNEWYAELKNSFFKKYKIAAIILISVASLYCMLSPLELYVGNILSFSFGWTTFVPIMALISLLVVIIGATIISLFNNATYKVICVGISIFSILSYVQYMFMNTKLMEEDGSRLDLATMGNYPRVNLAVWIIVGIILLCVCYCIKDRWTLALGGICGFLSAIQVVAVISLIITCINSPAPRYYQLSGDKQFTVAKDNNVIILVPDTFARTKLNNLLAYDPDGNYMDIFRDFTYYENMYSKQHPTLPSLIYLLTGNDAEDGIDRRLTMERVMWQKEAWTGDICNSFFNEIHNNGYKFYMNIPAPCELVGAYEDVVGKIDNIEYAVSNVDKVKLTKMLVSMSFYSCVPYVFKPPFEYFSWDFELLENYGGKQAAYKNEDFYSDIQDGISVDDTTDNKVHMIVWHGFHDEYTNDEFCNYVPPEEISKVSDEQNSKGVMLCIDTYLEKLKEIGRYDDSTIIIMGDHGVSKMHDGCVFVKMPNERHEGVNIDHSDKTYADFRATVIDMIGSDRHEEFGDSWVKDR